MSKIDDIQSRSVKLCKLIYDRIIDKEIGYEIRKLLEEGVLIDFQDQNKKTAIHLAIEKCDVICVKFLLQFKPSLEVKDGNGKTPVELAESNGCEDISNILLNSTVDVVNESYVEVIAFESLTREKIEAIKLRPTFKVLKLINCPSVITVLNKIEHRAYVTTFNESSHLFFIAIETKEPHNIQDDHESMKKALKLRRPMIVQLTSSGSQNTKIYFKDDKMKNFVEITDTPQITQGEFYQAVQSEDCNMKLLVAALRSNLFGHFNGNLLDTRLNTNEDRSEAVNKFAQSNALCHRFFKLFDDNQPHIDRINAALSFKGDQSLLALMDLPFELSDKKLKLTEYQQDVLHVVDCIGYNLLMMAAELLNLDAVKLLLRCDCDFNHSDGSDNHASDICWDVKAFDCLAELIEAGSPYPSNFSADKLEQSFEAHERINEMSEVINSFHANIKKGKTEEVKKFITSHPHIKHAYDSNNKCALTVALESKEIDIHSMLLSEGYESGADDDYQSACSESKFKDEIRNSHRKYFKEAFKEPHLKRLLKMFRLSFGSKDRAKCSTIIRRMFDELNEIDEIIPILQICSLSDKLRIVFDFNCDSVADMDSSKESSPLGATYQIDGFIYIGAKNEFYEVTGTLIHEMTHYAMKLTYDNMCKPYDVGDIAKTNLFESKTTETKKICDANPSTDLIVTTVFECYKKELWHQELIVRVPELLAHYKTNAKALKAAERNTPELFHFYREKTLKDVAAKSKDLFQQYLISKINNQTGMARKIEDMKVQFDNAEKKLKPTVTLITSKAPQMTLGLLGQAYLPNSNIFVSLEQVAIGNILDKIVKVNAKESSTALIVDSIGQAQKYQESIRKLLKDNENIKTIALVMTEAESSKVKEIFPQLESETFTHKWGELIESSKVNLLDQNVIFQGVEMKINELVEPSSEAMNFFPLGELVDCKDFKIGHVLHQTSHKFYIPRKFIEKGQESSARHTANAKNFEELLRNQSRMGAMIISDDAGSGKSVTLFEIAKSLHTAYPDRWVLFVDLKRHIEAFKGVEDHERIKKFEDFIVQIILKNEQNFDRELFRQMFLAGKTFVVFDGFDEISPNYKDLLLHILKLFMAVYFMPRSRNQLYITTRPHLESDLEDVLGKSVFKLEEFSKESQTSFLREHWQSVGFEIGQEDFEVLSKRLLEKFSEIAASKIIGLPILMSMTAEIFEDSTKENLLHKVDSISIASVFREFVEKYFARWTNNENKISRSETVELLMAGGVLEIHHNIAINHIFNEEFMKLDVDESDAEKISRVGLIRYDKTEKSFQFIHETFAEYFVADFVWFHFKKKNRVPMHDCRAAVEILMMDMVRFTQVSYEPYVVRTFLDQTLEAMKFSPSEAFCKSVADVFSEVSVSKNNFGLLMDSLDGSRENFASLLLSIVEHVEKEVLLKILQIKTSTGYNASLMAAAHGSNKIVSNLWNIITHLTDDSKEIFIQSDRDFENVLSKAARNKNVGVLTTLCTNLNAILTKDEIKKMMFEINKNNIIEIAAYGKNEVFLELLAVLSNYFSPGEMKNLLLAVDGGYRNLFHRAVLHDSNKTLKMKFDVFKTNFNVDEQKSFFNQKLKSGNMFHHAAPNKNDKIFETIIESTRDVFSSDEIKSMLMAKDSKGSNVVHIIARGCGNVNVLNELNLLLRERLSDDNIRSLLLEVNSKGQNCFRLAANNTGLNFQIFCEIFENLISIEDQTRLLQQSSQEIDIIRLACGKYNTNEIVPLETIKHLLVRRHAYYKRNAFHHVAFQGDVDAWNKLISFAQARFSAEEVKSFLLSWNDHDGNCLHQAIHNNSHRNMVEAICKTIKTLLSVEEQNKMFRQKNFYKVSVFHLAALDMNMFVCYSLYDLLGPTLSKEMFKEKNSNGDNMLLYSKRVTPLDEGMSLGLINFLEDVLTNDEIKNLFFDVDRKGRNFFHITVRGFSKLEIKSSSKAIKAILNRDDQKKFFGIKSPNIFHLAAKNSYTGIFSTLHECLKDVLTENEIKSLIHEKHSDNRNILHLICQHQENKECEQRLRDFLKVLKVICAADEIKKFLTSSDDNGCNCLLLAVQYKNQPLLRELFNFIQSELGCNDQKNLIKKFDNVGRKIFMLAVKNSEIGIFSTLHECLKYVLTDTEVKSLIQDKDSENRNVLHWICVHQYSNNNSEKKLQEFLKVMKVVCDADEFKKILTSLDNSGSNCFLLAAKSQNQHFLEELLSIIRSKLSIDEQRSLFLKCDNDGKYIFTCATMNSEFLSFLAIHEGLRNALTDIDIKSLISIPGRILIQKKDSNNRNILHLICSDSNMSEKILQEFLKVLKVVCDADELKKFLTSSDNHCSTSLLFAAQCKGQFFFKELFSFIRSELSIDELRDFFQKCDNDGDNIFQCASANRVPEMLSFIEQFAKEILSESQIEDLKTEFYLTLS